MPLLITQVNASQSIGDPIKSKPIAFSNVEQFRIRLVKIAPRKVLPTSPMKILAGDQFHFIKPNKLPTKIHKDESIIMEAYIKTISIEPATSPSNPSMKLVKFIIPVEPIIINGNSIIGNILNA